jgi:hypothetical protein
MEAIAADIGAFLLSHPGLSARLSTDPERRSHFEFDSLLALFDCWEALLDDPHWARHDTALVVKGRGLWFDYQRAESDHPHG